MDPNATMRRLLDAIQVQDEDECDAALEDLVSWLRSGGFPPVFTSEMAGLTKWGEPKRVLRFPRISIQTVSHLDDSQGWELVEWTFGGERFRGYKLARS